MLKFINSQKYLKTKSQKQSRGFTIIETMIAVALFVVVVMTGMDALLNANVIHQKSQDMRSILDSLNFIMEDMSRNIRTGYDFRCIYDNDFSASAIVLPKSCVNGGALAFEYAYGDSSIATDQWIYKVESPDGLGVVYNLSKSTDGGTTWVQLNPPEVNIDAISGFSVFGAEPLSSADSQQPLVTIRLSGRVVMKNGTISPFSLQTSASQRLLDIPAVDIVPYQYVRWEITKRRASANSIQASEFVLLQNGVPLAWPGGTSASNPGGQNPPTELPAKAIDGSVPVLPAVSKWLDLRFNLGNDASLIGNSRLVINRGAGNRVLFNGYRWATGNDTPARDPVSWQVSGSNDGVTWTVLDTVTDYTTDPGRNRYQADFSF